MIPFPENLVIVGAGGLAREAAWIVREINSVTPRFHLLGFISPEEGALGNDEWALARLPADTRFVVAIGEPLLRFRLAERYASAGFSPATLLHPSVRADDSVQVGSGTIISAGVTLSVDISIGNHCHIDTQAAISHDVCIGDFCTLHPGVCLTGNVRLGRGVEVGVGAVFKQGIEVTNGVIIGAGAVVVKSLMENGTFFGVPATFKGPGRIFPA